MASNPADADASCSACSTRSSRSSSGDSTAVTLATSTGAAADEMALGTNYSAAASLAANYSAAAAAPVEVANVTAVLSPDYERLLRVEQALQLASASAASAAAAAASSARLNSSSAQAKTDLFDLKSCS